jgi:proteic killer suppression protein
VGRKRTRIDIKLHKRILVRLDRLDVAAIAEEMNLPGFNFHMLQGPRPVRYTVHVNGPWCLTFSFENGDAFAVDLEQYH